MLRACHRVVDEVEERMLSTLTPVEAVAFGRALEGCLEALTETRPGSDRRELLGDS